MNTSGTRYISDAFMETYKSMPLIVLKCSLIFETFSSSESYVGSSFKTSFAVDSRVEANLVC
jgi:hypothetical protein